MWAILLGTLSNNQSGTRQLGYLFVWLFILVLLVYLLSVFYAPPAAVSAFSGSIVGILGVLGAVPTAAFLGTRVAKSKYGENPPKS